MKRNKFKNINEEISRIKDIIVLNEQCGPDLAKCETDLEAKGYVVTNPLEKGVSKARADDANAKCNKKDNSKPPEYINKGIKEGMKLLVDKGITHANTQTLEVRNSAFGCFILVTSRRLEKGKPKYVLQLYADKEFLYTYYLNAANGSKKLAWTGTWESTGTHYNLEYKGLIVSGGGGKAKPPTPFEILIGSPPVVRDKESFGNTKDGSGVWHPNGDTIVYPGETGKMMDKDIIWADYDTPRKPSDSVLLPGIIDRLQQP